MLIVERLGSSLLERDGVLKSTQILPLPVSFEVYHRHKQSNAKIIIPHLAGSHADHLREKFLLIWKQSMVDKDVT